jgi:hypothetical protein
MADLNARLRNLCQLQDRPAAAKLPAKADIGTLSFVNLR